ncbi:acyl-CoA N-acyltransferase [Mollisia scopiformis]|uniref:Acyl-CoA N-acyltransferase n=1 Tax=Mollisia scopiformis TaxID=149040 RepID=A0A194XMM4_MOLSC|nr:acyl-CoA N-acyltransferase [Mollisia scopiformis]KUJ21381.1 acyl-CoA N-acyltransferase [Mollisia scopiformis]
MAIPVAITKGGRERVPQASALFAEAFATDPVITYILHNMPESKRLTYLPKYFNALLTAAALNDATFIEIDDFKSCVTMMHPGKKVDNPWTLIPAGLVQMLFDIGFGPCWRMLFEFSPMTDRCKLKGLRGQKKYFYVFFTATASSAQGQGLCTKLLNHWQDIASREKVPMWLEATTEKSMKIYAKCGFEVVERMTLGKGKVEPKGLKPVKEGGSVKGKEELEGVPIWAMVWWPEGSKPVGN